MRAGTESLLDSSVDPNPTVSAQRSEVGRQQPEEQK